MLLNAHSCSRYHSLHHGFGWGPFLILRFDRPVAIFTPFFCSSSQLKFFAGLALDE